MVDGDDKKNAAEEEVSETEGVEAAADAPGEDPAPPKTKAWTGKMPSMGASEAVTRRTASSSDAGAFESSYAVEPSEEGLFVVSGETAPVDPEAARGYMPRTRSRAAVGIFGGVLVVVLAVGGMIVTSSSLSHDLGCFFSQQIEECKTREIRQKRKTWSDQDRKAINKYGDTELMYFPTEALLKIKQVTYAQEGLDGLKKQDSEREIPNRTGELKANEVVERVVLQTFPVVEATKHTKVCCDVDGAPQAVRFDLCSETPRRTVEHQKCPPPRGTTEKDWKPAEGQVCCQVGEEDEGAPQIHLLVGSSECGPPGDRSQVQDPGACGESLPEVGSVDKVYTYDYVLEFSLEGYKTKTITIRQDDWQMIGPGNLSYPWNGLDLEPELETVKLNLAKVMSDIYCVHKLKKIEWDGVTFSEVPEETLDELLLRNQFKTQEIFFEFHQFFMRSPEYAEWWKGMWEAAKQQICE